MKKRILVIAMFLVLIFIAFIIINKIINNKDNSLKTYSKTIKNFTLEIPNNLKFEEINEYGFRLTSDKWFADLSILYDENNLILDYPMCTKLRLENEEYTTGELKKDGNSERNYIVFSVASEKEKSLVAYHKLNNKFVMYIGLVNNDESFSEAGLETLFNIVKTAKYNDSNKYLYQSYLSDWYHQCHDIDKLDKEDFEKDNPVPQKR